MILKRNKNKRIKRKGIRIKKVLMNKEIRKIVKIIKYYCCQVISIIIINLSMSINKHNHITIRNINKKIKNNIKNNITNNINKQNLNLNPRQNNKNNNNNNNNNYSC